MQFWDEKLITLTGRFATRTPASQEEDSTAHSRMKSITSINLEELGLIPPLKSWDRRREHAHACTYAPGA